MKLVASTIPLIDVSSLLDHPDRLRLSVYDYRTARFTAKAGLKAAS